MCIIPFFYIFTVSFPEETPKPPEVEPTFTFIKESKTADQGTDPISEEQSLNEEATTEGQGQSLKVDQGTETEAMGAGASKDGEVVEDDDQYVKTERKRPADDTQQQGPSSPRQQQPKRQRSISRRLAPHSKNSSESSRTTDKNDVLKYIGKKACSPNSNQHLNL